MTLPSSGAITMAQINTELGFPSTNAISFEDPPVLALAGVAAGAAISMASFYGKTAASTLRGTASPSTQTLGGVTGVTGTTTISAAGGTGPYTYATSIVSGSGALSNATTTTPSIFIGGARGTYTVALKTVITDHVGATYTVNWSATAVLTS